MFLRRVWLGSVAAAVLAASAPAQEPLDIDAYVGIVLRAHPRAAQMRAVENLAAAERRAAGVWPDPILEASLGRGRGFPDGLVSNGEWDYAISQTIPWPSARSARMRAAELSGRVMLSSEDAARWDLELEARLAFWRLAYSRRALDLARRADADAIAILELTTRRVDVGEAREADRSRALAERVRVELSSKNAEREARAAETALRLLAVETLPQALELRSEPPKPVTAEEIEARRQALARSSPFLRIALAALEREMGLVAVARAARGPDLGLSWLQASEIDKKSWSLSLGVRLPVWNGGWAEVARAEASASLARAVLERSRMEVSLVFESAVQEAEAADDGLRLLETTLVPTARKTWNLVRLSYEEGETSLLDLLDAQRTLRVAEIEELQAGFGLGRAWIEIERIGGQYKGAGEKR